MTSREVHEAIRTALNAGTENLHEHWLEFIKENVMARLDDLQSAVSGIGPAIDRLIALHGELGQKLEAAGVEDPRIGQIADELTAMRAKIETVAPAPADKVAAEPAQQ